MKIIADSGSTKCAWLLTDGVHTSEYRTRGINAVQHSPEQIREALAELPPCGPVEAVYFYGAGCGGTFPEATEKMVRELRTHFGAGHIEAQTDLLGAARALFGRGEGVACILGTGSNSCWCRGGEIVENIPPLGYVLGDEGSGAAMGRNLVNGIFKGHIPLREEFLAAHGLTYEEIIRRVYREPYANRFLASFAPFVHAHLDCPEVRAMVAETFADFAQRNLSRYPVHLTVACIGGVAAAFEGLLRECSHKGGTGSAGSPHHLPKDLSNTIMENRITEQASAYDNLQRMSVHDILTGINREDARVHEAVAKTIPVMERLVERVVERMERGGRMFYIGAGTSGRLGVTDASELPPTYGVPFDRVIGLIAGGDGALRRAVENAEDDTAGAWRDMAPYHPTADDVLVGIAASGTTPYVVGGLRMAREHGLLTASITCNPSSPVAAEAEYALEAVVGPEFVTGSTRMKAGTAQKLMLNMLSTAVMIRLGRVEGNRMVNMQLTNDKLVGRGTRMVAEASGLSEAQARALLLQYGSVKKALEHAPKPE